jgi:MFS family permease
MDQPIDATKRRVAAMLATPVTDATSHHSAFSRWRSATLAPFRQRVFAVFWLASLLSSFGSLIQTVGASWLMTTLAPSAAMIALVQTASALPFFCLSLASGALADIYDRRRIMLVSQLAMLSVSSLLAYVTWSGAITPWTLLGFTFLVGCGAAVYAPVWQSSISEQVDRKLIPAAVTANALGFNFARSTGPAIGGVLVAAAGATLAFAINAASYLGLIATLLWWKAPPRTSHLPPEPLGAAIAAGLRYVRLSPTLLAILVRCFAFSVAASSMQ